MQDKRYKYFCIAINCYSPKVVLVNDIWEYVNENVFSKNCAYLWYFKCLLDSRSLVITNSIALLIYFL